MPAAPRTTDPRPPARRGRPREFDVDRAVDRAMDVLWRRGYRATTTRDLEAALGVRPSSLYRAFGSKAGLADAAVGRYRGLIERALLAPLLGADDGLAAIDRFMAGLGDWLAADDGRGCLIGRLLSEGPPADPAIARRLADYRTALRAAIVAALERAAARGEIGADTVGSRTEVLVAWALGLNQAVQSGHRPDALRTMVAGLRAEIGRWGGEGLTGPAGG